MGRLPPGLQLSEAFSDVCANVYFYSQAAASMSQVTTETIYEMLYFYYAPAFTGCREGDFRKAKFYNRLAHPL